MMNEGLLLHYLTNFTTIMHITVVTTAVAATATANVLYEHPVSKKDQQVIQVICQVYFTHFVVEMVVELMVVSGGITLSPSRPSVHFLSLHSL